MEWFFNNCTRIESFVYLLHTSDRSKPFRTRWFSLKNRYRFRVVLRQNRQIPTIYGGLKVSVLSKNNSIRMQIQISSQNLPGCGLRLLQLFWISVFNNNHQNDGNICIPSYWLLNMTKIRIKYVPKFCLDLAVWLNEIYINSWQNKSVDLQNLFYHF